METKANTTEQKNFDEIEKIVANERYQDLVSEVGTQIEILKNKIKMAKQSQAKNPRNWGFVGEMEHILVELKNINEFLG